jgi:hypothetical protein
LAARGETSNDLLTNLFKGYGAATDKIFGRKKERYKEGEDVSANALMEQANSKYKLMKENATWNALSEKEEKILALMLEVRSLKKSKKKDTPYKKGDKPDKGKSYQNGKKVATPKPSWFEKEPRPEEISKPKGWNGKTWYYCSSKMGGKCSGACCIHKPSQCEGKAHKFEKKESKRKADDSGNTESKLKLAKAYETRIKEVSNLDKESDMDLE